MSMPPRFLFRLFPLAGRTSAWVEQRFSPAGRLVIGLLVAGVLFGIDIRQTLGYQIAALNFALIITSLIFSARWKPGISVVRVLPPHVTATIPTSYWLEITNHGSRLERDLIVHDRLPNPRISFDEFQQARKRGAGGATNWFDRAVGFPRWVELRRNLRGAEIDAQRVPAIPPATTIRVKVQLTVRRRGWVHFDTVHLLRPDPLGLFRAQYTIKDKAELLSLPRRYATPRIKLRSERRYQKGGISLAMAVGDSQEFASLRDYQPGDPRRHIHWRSFAKTGKLIVKQYQDEYFDRHALVIDTHLVHARPALFEAVISVGASIAAGEKPRDSILDVIFAGSEVVQLSVGRGLGDALQALAYLAEIQPCDDGDINQLAELLRERAAQFASVILVLGRMDAARETLISDLAQHGVPSVMLYVTEEDSDDPSAADSSQHDAFRIRCGHIAEDLARVELKS
ncbi:MAG: DUF58 domain-containing protein [Gammaproteobacteria bacterium]|nr:DUF58 domain-containing protein [Gammaproteobacteria bacterium]